MSDSKHPMNAVPALLDERRRYEAWLAALEARRDTTPAHVFERVHADYTTRLRRVDEQLASQQQSIQDERASVQSRLTLLQAEERMRLDERAELELRMQVGELSGPDAITAAGAVDDALHQSATERALLTRQLSELDALLAQRAAESRAAAPRPAPAPAAQAAAPRAPAPQPAVPQAAPAPAPQPVAAHAAAAPSQAAQPTATPAAPARRVSQQVNAPAPAPGGSFDELAFLSTVVGAEAVGQDSAAPARSQTPAPAPAIAHNPPAAPPAAPVAPAQRNSAPTVQPMPRLKPLTARTPAQAPPPPRPSTGIIRDDPAATSLLDGIGSSPESLGGERPLAANDPANTPIILRTSGSTEQSKTLRCAECGAMNYPTEWYCERCGAELAAL
jgi:hypothetical protein